MRKALFPGTFDPPSLGHLDLIERASHACDKLYVGIATNVSKTHPVFFSTEEKIDMLQKICRSFPYVEVVAFDGLVVDFAKKNRVDFLIRGLRAFTDFEYELRMALANRKLSGLETVFLMANESLSHISSTLIRELAKYKSRLHDFVPKEIEPFIYERLSSTL